MTCDIELSSSVLVNDAVSPTDRMLALLGESTLKLKIRDEQTMTSFQDTSETSYSLTFVGEGMRAAHAKLKQLEARRLLNGQPRFTIDGYADAVSQGQGELVTLSFGIYSRGNPNNLETFSRTGILTQVSMTIQGGAKAQQLTCLFYVCDRLHVRQSGNINTYTRVGA